MIDLTPAQAAPRIASLLAARESRTLDFKRVSGKMVGKALETLCAFANTEGGILALGVADEKQEQGAARFYGIEENPEALDELVRKTRTQFHAPALYAARRQGRPRQVPRHVIPWLRKISASFRLRPTSMPEKG